MTDLGPAAAVRPRSIALLPSAVFLVYLACTAGLFLAGPWEWPVPDASAVAAYLGLALLAVALGSALGSRVLPSRSRFPTRLLVPLAAVVIGINLLLVLPTYRATTGAWIPDFWHALRSPGEVYLETWRRRESAASWVWYLRILLGPAMALLLPLVCTERRRLPHLLVALGALAVAAEIAFSIATGTNRLFGNVSLLVPWLLLGGHVSGHATFRTRGQAARVIFALLVLWIGFAAFFQRTMATRRGAPARTLEWDLTHRVTPPSAAKRASTGRPAPALPPPGPSVLRADPEHLLVRASPDFARTGLLGITHYLTQGYYALSLALDEPYVPMWGAGHSMFLSRQVERLPGFSGFSQRSYPARIEKDGWDAYGRWSSVYPWWASDVGFPGALVVVLLVAAGLAASWRDLIAGTNNPFAAGAFAQFALFLAYVPANNQCLQSGESLTAFWAMVLGWLVLRRRVDAG